MAIKKIRGRRRFGPPAARLADGVKHLGLGKEIAGQSDDLAPHLVPRAALRRQVLQLGVLGATEAVLAPDPPPMAADPRAARLASVANDSEVMLVDG